MHANVLKKKVMIYRQFMANKFCNLALTIKQLITYFGQRIEKTI